jgi:diguanylate cyclase (GGDEF)-like protein
MIDIDNFEQVNTNYGRSGGDAVILALAKIVRDASTGEYIPARYGGDEFVIVFPNTDREQAFLTVEHIRQELEQATIVYDPNQPGIAGLTTSGGVAAYPNDARSSAEILRKADQALYRAKASGRNKVRLAYEEKMVPKTTHFTVTQLERLSKLAEERSVSEAELLREALDDLLNKYGVTVIEN